MHRSAGQGVDTMLALHAASNGMGWCTIGVPDACCKMPDHSTLLVFQLQDHVVQSLWILDVYCVTVMTMKGVLVSLESEVDANRQSIDASPTYPFQHTANWRVYNKRMVHV